MKIAIFGASGHGKVIADLAELLGYKITFFDDISTLKKLEHWNVDGDFNKLLATSHCYNFVFVAIGNNSIREDVICKLESKGIKLATLIHPKAYVSRFSTLGSGSVVLANAVVNTAADIGKGSIINTGAVIEHDCVLGDFSHVSPNASLAGGCQVGSGSWIGIGASVKELTIIGSNSVIGAGSVIVKNIPDSVMAFGVPAKVINQL